MWRGLTPTDFEPAGIARASVEKLVPGGSGARRLSHHVQRHYPETAVRWALERAGLRLAAVYGQDDDGHLSQPLDEDVHTKAVHVVTRLQ